MNLDKYGHLADLLEQSAKAIRELLAAVRSANDALPGRGIMDESVLAPDSPFHFSVRVRKAFMRKGINTVADLVDKSAEELLELRNFGETSLCEVREKLAKHDLALLGDASVTTGQKPPISEGDRS